MFPYVYVWGNNPRRKQLKGRHCRVLERMVMNSVVVEFENGEKVVTSVRALRKSKQEGEQASASAGDRCPSG